MRIIAGTLKGRRLEPPTRLPVRPTTDMAREGLFNILNNYVYFEDCEVLDLCAGTGAMSLEFVSRGVQSVVSVDINSACIEFIKSSATRLSVANLRAVRADLFDFLKRPVKQFDIIFADPPYDMERVDELPDSIFSTSVLKPEGLFILEHSAAHHYEEHPYFWQQRSYGKVNFSFFTREVTP